VLKWKLKAKGVKAHEILLETIITKVNGKYSGEKWDFFTDDSMMALRR